jgi:hypothetical protein
MKTDAGHSGTAGAYHALDSADSAIELGRRRKTVVSRITFQAATATRARWDHDADVVFSLGFLDRLRPNRRGPRGSWIRKRFRPDARRARDSLRV